MQGKRFAGFLTLSLALPLGHAQAGSAWDLSLVSEGDDALAAVPVSATPFDPTSIPYDRFIGRDSYSSRAVAIELVLNAVQVRYSDVLIYRPKVAGGYRISTRWRFRVSNEAATLRYEIRF